MPTEVFAFPAVEDTEPDGDTFHRPKYVDDDRVEGYNSALIPAPDGFPGTATPGGQIYIVAVTATQDALDAAKAQSDVWSIGNESGDDVTPTQAADYLNQHFRPQTLAELKEALGDDYRDLSPSEWFERLGLDG